jgi:hypothetical protein
VELALIVRLEFRIEFQLRETPQAGLSIPSHSQVVPLSWLAASRSTLGIWDRAATIHLHRPEIDQQILNVPFVVLSV